MTGARWLIFLPTVPSLRMAGRRVEPRASGVSSQRGD
ncbi:hypothetical protein MYMAC_005426 [Corallococcus macrosporus DSM 14697]|uniref:Uncharacterized protein n=1 Tax=Corallococcus macrosporus DSM 14697 TaxID=1189310 RepID=A0A250K238_9BACT|nr:hypothetical protein MYMAC_005426 [Corallococcus macrosporus DSM 14697]